MREKAITAGLRVDVDTLRGTRMGAANLLALFRRYGIRATFFFSMGPDNMGRHLLRLLHPAFFAKMVRTRAVALYGPDILFKGTLWPGPIIGRKGAESIRKSVKAGHEIGLHCWDHHRWQTRIHRLTSREIGLDTHRALTMLQELVKQPVTCMAAPAWRITAAALADRSDRNLLYCSDCRGRSIFLPNLEGRIFRPPQIPTTLPTCDELLGRGGITPHTYNNHLLDLFRPGRLNVLTIHAEVEGMAFFSLFQDFLNQAEKRRICFVPLGELLRREENDITTSALLRCKISGRQGWVSCQGPLPPPRDGGW